MSYKINSSQILKLSEQSFKNNIKPLLFFGAIFGLAIFIVSYLMLRAGDTSAFVLFYPFLMVAIYAKLAVLVHRCILMDEKGFKNVLKWRSEEALFMLAIFGVIILALFLSWILINVFIMAGDFGRSDQSEVSSASQLFVFVIYIVVAVVASRLALIFPGLAIGNRVNLNEIWQKTKNHKWLLFFLIIVFPIMTSFILDFFPANNLLMVFISGILTLMLVMFEVVILSHCYSELMLKKEDDQMISDDFVD